MKMPVVSVCLPTYNYANLIDKAIASVLNQTYTNYELVIIDDASTDNTDEVVKSFTDVRIKYIKNVKNLGIFANFNKCMRLSKGTYIKFLCADDLLAPEALERMVSVMNSDKSVGIISTAHILHFDDGTDIAQKLFTSSFKSNGKQFLKECLLNDISVFGNPSCVMIRRDCVRYLGPFLECPLSGWAVDHEMWLRIMTLYNIAYISDFLCTVKRHSKTASQNVYKRQTDIADRYYIFSQSIEQSPLFNCVRKSHKIVAKGRVTVKAMLMLPNAFITRPLFAINCLKNIAKHDTFLTCFYWRLLYKLMHFRNGGRFRSLKSNH